MVENIIEDNTIQCNKIEMKAFACVGTCTNNQRNITFSHQHVSSPLDTNTVLLLKYISQCPYYLLLTFYAQPFVPKQVSGFNCLIMCHFGHPSCEGPWQFWYNLHGGLKTSRTGKQTTARTCVACAWDMLRLAHSHRPHIVSGITYWKRITWDL